MENEIITGYYYGMKFNREWLIRGIRELLDYIKYNKKHNIISYFPVNDKYFYIIYNENLIKGNSNIESFKKCNHWLYIREKLDIIFDEIVENYICEFNEYPKKIFLF